MADRDLDQMFAELARAPLTVPERAAVLALSRRRRRNRRIMASLAALAAVVIAAAGAGYAHSLAGHAAPAAGRGHRGGQGTGRLLLGLDSSGIAFVFASSADPTRTTQLTGLQPLAGGQSQIATDPAGGWVVSYAPAWTESSPIQQAGLATVSVHGAVRPFGPASFGATEMITSLAVRPGGAAVAIALTRAGSGHRQLPAVIELVPMPGHRGGRRTWTLDSADATEVRSLSWAPGGTDLTYVPGPAAGLFTGRGAVTLNTAAAGDTAPAGSAWPDLPGSCSLEAGAWSNTAYLALEDCGSAGELLREVRAKDGTPLQRGVQVPAYLDCPDSQLDPAPASDEVLISGCGLEVSRDARVQPLLGQLAAGAWAG